MTEAIKKIPHRGVLSHVDHIPGGKRFWKVGRIYQLNASVGLWSAPTHMVELTKKDHSRRNMRWNVNEQFSYASHIRDFGTLNKSDIFILLAKPDYKTVRGRGGGTLDGNYQIKVLCNEKIGWIKVRNDLSPRYYCSPVK